ncbi:MAG: hypothetical protein ACE5GW_01850 [Planctomycetota bacterium]
MGLAVLIAWQLYGLGTRPASLGVGDRFAPGDRGEVRREGMQDGGGAGGEAEMAEPPPFPEGFLVIDRSGIFGSVPPTKVSPPKLRGLVGSYAIIVAPDGSSGMVREGGEVGGVKVLRIATNRVLIEHKGERQELTIYSGLGSEPLLEPEKESKP